jgi:hypothetical protein
MNNFSVIRVLCFSIRKEEWLIRIEKFLAKAKNSDIKDFLVHMRLKRRTEDGKEMMRAIEINEISF